MKHPHAEFRRKGENAQTKLTTPMPPKKDESLYPQYKPKKTTAEVALAAAKAQLDENAKELAALRDEVNRLKEVTSERTRLEYEYDYAVAMLKRYGVLNVLDCGHTKHLLRFGVDIALAGWMKSEAAKITEAAYQYLYRRIRETEPEPKQSAKA